MNSERASPGQQWAGPFYYVASAPEGVQPFTIGQQRYVLARIMTCEKSEVLCSMPTKAVQQLDAQALLKRHRRHMGMYARVAKKLGIDSSYVSRVASGDRTSEGILNALVEELRRIEKR